MSFFTVEQANNALVFIKPLALELKEKWGKVVSIKEECDALILNHMEKSPILKGKEEALDMLLEQIENGIENMKLAGCEYKGFEEGVIDFPAKTKERIIHLCWKLGEEKVIYYHEIFEDIGERKLITEEVAKEISIFSQNRSHKEV